jgi:hypothetical protein
MEHRKKRKKKKEKGKRGEKSFKSLQIKREVNIFIREKHFNFRNIF